MARDIMEKLDTLITWSTEEYTCRVEHAATCDHSGDDNNDVNNGAVEEETVKFTFEEETYLHLQEQARDAAVKKKKQKQLLRIIGKRMV